MYDVDVEAAYAEEKAYADFDMEFPGWEQWLAENDFNNAYDVMDELKEIGML